MHEDRPRRGRRLCANCQYPTLRLDGFEGTSSQDAPVFGNRVLIDEESPFPLWRLIKAAWAALRGTRKPSRKKQVAQLRADILPEAPDAMICPQCLRVVFPDEFA